MSQHSLKEICMTAVNKKAKQPINKRHGTMQGDQRYSFKSQNSQHFPKKEIHGCHNWNVMAWPKKERHSTVYIRKAIRMSEKNSTAEDERHGARQKN